MGDFSYKKIQKKKKFKTLIMMGDFSYKKFKKIITLIMMGLGVLQYCIHYTCPIISAAQIIS
jgi:hypothetical protein